MIPIVPQKQIQKYFKRYEAHLDGPLCIGATQNQFISIGSDDMIFCNSFAQNFHETKAIDSEYSTQQYSSILLTNEEYNYLGTSSGKLFIIKKIDFSQIKQIYQCSQKIFKIQKVLNTNYIAAVCKQQIVFLNLYQNKFQVFNDIHDGNIVNIQFFDKFMLTLGKDLNINIYLIFLKQESQIKQGQSQLNLALIKSQRISGKTYEQLTSMKMNVNFGFLIDKGIKKLLIPGMADLQYFQFREQQTLEIQYNINSNIRHHQQIVQVKSFNNQFIFTETKLQSAIWNFIKKEKIITFDISFHDIYTITNTEVFLGINNSGNIYQFNRYELIEIVQSEKNHMAQNVQDYSNVNMQIQEIKKPVEKPKKKKKKKYVSKAGKIINNYPQMSIQLAYGQYMNAKFSFYNQVGCVVQRIESNSAIVELQYHNKNKLSKIKFCSQNRSLCYFALSNESFVYANLNNMWFQNQKMTKEGYKWDVKIKGLQGVALSGQWVAAINKQQISIYDLSGNLMYLASFDKKFITMAAYQDRLAVAYHASVPMWGSNILGIKIFKVTKKTMMQQRQVNLPIEPLSNLKWIGFSSQGMLFSQDSSQNIRLYDQVMDTWLKVFSVNPDKEKIFIQNIQEYSLYAFRIEQKQGFPKQPTVLPKSIPRKIPLDSIISQAKQPSYLNRLIFKKVIIKHEQLRNQLWRKYKYCRNKNHPNFNYSKTILSDAEIREMKINFSKMLKSDLEKFLNSGQFKNKQQHQKQKQKDMLLGQLEFLSFDDPFEDNDELAKTFGNLNINQIVKETLFKQEITSRDHFKKLNEIINLDEQKVMIKAIQQSMNSAMDIE